ncbi:MAG: GHKL domain-containing protein [Lachnospiraceae bacterium]|nr:GHKL domain-containing protein [Lachnospiraceae bacterium]
MAVALCIGSIVFVVALVLLMVSITTREHYKELAEMNKRLLESQAGYYEMLLEKENETRAFRHDMKNHLYCMRSLLEDKDYKGLKSYFDTTGILLEQLRPAIQTGNEMVNVILNNVVGKYPMVTYRVEGVMSNAAGLENHDLCAIFFNLLENAFAAAAKSEEKQVSVCFTEREEMWFCTIKNTVLHPVQIRNNRMQTEKEDTRRHGYGTINAVKCAEKNGGELRFACEEKVFTAELLLFKKQ